MINIKENNSLNTLNHSCAHLLAQAVKHLYPNAKFWVGPVIEDGFYYDIDAEALDVKITETESDSNNGTVPALVANIPIRDMKHRPDPR